ncbi:MAG: DUF1552 domain-containing protein [Verrucomicrobia bacterium]|nr:DUF1552 domain-containing protein [Verrucomicrobiota bacterium]
MTRSWRIPRRTFLRGLGTAVALPWLEAMASRRAEAALEEGRPCRSAFLFIPNGANMADWTPPQEGPLAELPPILAPLEPWRQELQVLSGLTHDKARPNGDGAGDHARSSATFLTGCQARKTDGADIRVGVSVDQVAAARVGHLTRLASLELGCDRSRQTGNCDSGYSCAYSFNISWKTPSTPMPPEVDPRLAFERLFASPEREASAESRARRRATRQSVLDFVGADARRLRGRLGATDRRKLDEYLAAVRDVEQRIERSGQFQAALPDYAQPSGIPDGYADHLRLMFDLIALAFQTDTTRVATFILAHDGSNRPYPFLGVGEGHHDLSHHGNDAAKQEKLTLINRFHVTQFGGFLRTLAGMKEGSGTLLDHCQIVYGSGISDGNRHNHDELPVLLAGRGAGRLQAGRHVRFPRNTPMTNLYLSLLDRMGISVDRLGDSTGPLMGI